MKKKLENFGYSLLPLVLWLSMQNVVAALFPVIVGFLEGGLSGMGMDTTGLMTQLQENYAYIVSIAMDGLVLLPGYFWLKNLPGQRDGRKISLKSAALMLLLGIAIQKVVTAILVFVQSFAPAAMEDYGRVMESLGMFRPSMWSVFYTVCMAPVAEELIFRGLTQRILEREFSFWTANLLQSLFFGIVHGNPVQGIYAFFIGILLGYLARRYQNLWAPILCHFAVNLSGLFPG